MKEKRSGKKKLWMGREEKKCRRYLRGVGGKEEKEEVILSFYFRFCRTIVFCFEKVLPYFEKILVIWLKHKQGKFPGVALKIIVQDVLVLFTFIKPDDFCNI